MPLLTARLALRPWTTSDAPAFVLLQNDSYDHLRTYMSWSDHLFTLEDAEARIQGWNHPQADGMHLVLGVFERETGLPVGEVGLHPRSGTRHVENPCMVSYWMGREYEGRGYAREAVEALLLTASVPAAYAMIEDDNHRSMNLVRRLGFSPDGRIDRFRLFRKELRVQEKEAASSAA
jgi:RimJ/RimL family protein N-acetyltransferase